MEGGCLGICGYLRGQKAHAVIQRTAEPTLVSSTQVHIRVRKIRHASRRGRRPGVVNTSRAPFRRSFSHPWWLLSAEPDAHRGRLDTNALHPQETLLHRVGCGRGSSQVSNWGSLYCSARFCCKERWDSEIRYTREGKILNTTDQTELKTCGCVSPSGAEIILFRILYLAPKVRQVFSCDRCLTKIAVL